MTSAHRIRASFSRADFRLEVDTAWDARVTVLFGPSGSGKSTLLELMLGLHPRADARVWIGGRELEPGLPPERRHLGWVPQDAALFPHLSVEQNVRFGSARAGAGGDTVWRRALEVLELERLRERRPAELSGGERQRVAIARALASGPRALLLDEPLASLDLPLRARVLPFLLRVRDELDLPILYITHDPDEALLVGEWSIVLDGGRVVATGRPREVLWSRAVLPLAEALGVENVLETVVRTCEDGEARVETAAGLSLTVPVPSFLDPETPLRLGLRAQDILIAVDPPGRISARNVLPARVKRLEPSGDGVLVHLDAGEPLADAEPLVAKLTTGAVDDLELLTGAAVHLVIKAQALRRLA